jgi:hypothetical protein
LKPGQFPKIQDFSPGNHPTPIGSPAAHAEHIYASGIRGKRRQDQFVNSN